MNHPQGATGYRIEQDGAAIVHACDFEPGHEKLDSVLREHAQNANILIVDSQYTPDEYESKRGWGHSTWLEGTKIARDANVEQLILTHHDPAHDDKPMDEILPCARRYFENTFIAKEGWTAAVLER
jgi:ribonuclease BN (tRNA processing enzyme)